MRTPAPLTPHQKVHQLLVSGQKKEARAALAALDQNDHTTKLLYGGLAMLERDFPRALPILRQLADDRPEDFTLHYNLGLCYYELGRFEEATQSQTRALTLNFGYAKGWLKLGACHLLQQDWPQALACYERAVGLDAADPELKIGFGTMLSILDDDPAAEKQYREALKLDPKAWEAEVALGFVLLRQGKWTEGWMRFEKRWMLPQFNKGPSIRMWAGAPHELDDKTVVVICEQGFGDSLQFSRYLPLVFARARETYLVGPRELARLFRATFPEITYLVQEEDPIPEYHILTALMSLPAVFDTTLKNVPPPSSYVVPMRNVGARVGVCWHGGARKEEPIAHADDNRRSISRELFDSIITACGPDTISLQQEDLRAWGCEDWYDTARIVAGLDLVITVDTAMAHLAASLGVETWILCRAGGCWRWLGKGTTTAWYPNSARLFRQRTLSDWRGAVAEIVKELAR